MALLTIPDPDALILTSIRPEVPDQLNRSIWTGRGKVSGLPGSETWALTAATEPLATEMEEQPWRAFLFGLRGRQNTFNFPVACQRHVGGKPQVFNATEAGYTLPLDGMEASTRILRAGQYMTVPLPSGHNRLVMLMADLVTDANGIATAQLNIALGEVPDDYTVVETAEPFVPVRSTDGNPQLSYQDGVSTATLNLEEAL